MENAINYLWSSINFVYNLQYIAICAAIFIPLAIFFPSKASQPLLNKEMIPNIIYWFCNGIITRPAGWLLGNFLYLNLFSQQTISEINQHGLPPLNQLPLIVQALLILLIMDFMQYWTHRMFHGNTFWKFHAIHHSPVVVDWLTTSRFHPVNLIIHSVLVGIIASMLGFNPEAWVILTPFNMIYSPLVHANLNWTYGPLRYVFASPVFHRWHHTHTNEGGNKNFAPTFPFLDIIFGTYYDPKGKSPEIFGLDNNETIPENVIAQLAYPFVKKSN